MTYPAEITALVEALGIMADLEDAGLTEYNRTVLRQAATLIAEQAERVRELEGALQKIVALPACDGETEQYRSQQDMRLVEQARTAARKALEGEIPGATHD